MHEIVEQITKGDKEKAKKKKMESKAERKKNRDKIRDEKKKVYDAEVARRDADPEAWEAERKAKKEEKEFSEPPLLGLVTRLLRGVKFDIKNIHIRFEDDFFAKSRPFSFGFTIQNVSLDNHLAEEDR